MKEHHEQTVRIALCQTNPTVGDFGGNTKQIISRIKQCAQSGADICFFPELAVSGYPPEDLLLRKSFMKANELAIEKISGSCKNIIAVIGFARIKNGKRYNSCAVISNGRIVGYYDKNCLPNYGVFDEKRYFSSGTEPVIVKAGNFTFGILICEDLWAEKSPAKVLAKANPDLIAAINASPYFVGKWKSRQSAAERISSYAKCHFAYTNLVGGQDELVFDGHSFATDNSGKIIQRGKQFEEDIVLADIPVKAKTVSRLKGVRVIDAGKISARTKTTLNSKLCQPAKQNAEIYNALCLGLRDYVKKNGFSKVVLGLSGGIDSALVAVLAADALGSENVKTIYMPSQYSAARSKRDSQKLAANIGVELMELPITDIFALFLKELQPIFKGTKPDTTEENLQARIRGTILMALSNKFGYLVLATGNKSEVSTGYSTLYGDMAGGLSIIKDVPKTLVYELCNFRNTISAAIPQSIIKRAPTAELRPGQKDEDNLPPYEILDKIINEYVENDSDFEHIAGLGIAGKTIKKTLAMIDGNEYKRRQAAPGIKITPKAFGKDRRLPITNRFLSFTLGKT